MKLGVNIDHIATLREARKELYPDPVWGGVLAQIAGADGIVCHLREDRRHIKERDLFILKEVVKVKLNLEMSTNKEIVEIAKKVRPNQVTLVPERRQEITTEGGLDLKRNEKKIEEVVKELKERGVSVSLFIDPDIQQIESAKKIGAQAIEIHTGRYAQAKEKEKIEEELKKIKEAVLFAKKMGLETYAGHGLNYINITPIAKIKEIEEFNIGHSIISRAVFVGLIEAIKEMKKLILDARSGD